MTPPSATDRPDQRPEKAQVRAIRKEVHRSEAAISKALFKFLVTSARTRRFWAQHPLDGQDAVAQTPALSDEAINDLVRNVLEKNGEMLLIMVDHFMEVEFMPILRSCPLASAKTKTTAPKAETPSRSHRRA